MGQNVENLKCTVSNGLGEMRKESIVAYDSAISLEGLCKNTEVSRSSIPTGIIRRSGSKTSYYYCPLTHFTEFDTICTVHRNLFSKQTNKMHFLYVFILQSFLQLYMLRTTISFIIRCS